MLVKITCGIIHIIAEPVPPPNREIVCTTPVHMQQGLFVSTPVSEELYMFERDPHFARVLTNIQCTLLLYKAVNRLGQDGSMGVRLKA